MGSLSADRANAARRIMQDHGVRENQIGQVRGFADQRLRQTNDPKHPSNRRISIIVRYADMDDSEPPAPARKETLSAEKAPATGHGAAAHSAPVAHR